MAWCRNFEDQLYPSIDFPMACVLYHGWVVHWESLDDGIQGVLALGGGDRCGKAK